jgi:hypothetical protein
MAINNRAFKQAFISTPKMVRRLNIKKQAKTQSNVKASRRSNFGQRMKLLQGSAKK